VGRSVVYFNGVAVPYKAVSPTEPQLILDADLVKTPGRHTITVKNPEPYNRVADVSPWGTGVSIQAYVLLRYKS
jgi:hypothetical protein